MEYRNWKEYKQRMRRIRCNCWQCLHHSLRQTISRSQTFLLLFFSKWGTIREGSIVEDQLSGQSLLWLAVTCHTCHTRACVCISSATGTTVGKLELDSSTSCRYYNAVHMHGHRITLSTLRSIPVLHTPLASLLSNHLMPLSRILNKDHNSCIRGPQVNEILHMLSIHKMACNAPS